MASAQSPETVGVGCHADTILGPHGGDQLSDDIRFHTPLYSVAEAARVVGVPATTLAAWTKGQGRTRRVVGEVVVTAFPATGAAPSIPFVGLAEALVLVAVRRAGVPMQRIRPAFAALERDMGISHALASSRLSIDGAEVLFDFGKNDTGDIALIEQIVVMRNGKRVFVDAISEYLRRIEYGPDGYAGLIHVPGYRSDVVCDPRRSFGQPIFARGAARVDDVVSRFQIGETIEELTNEFGVGSADIEDALRVASRRAA